jgi:6-phosphogluconolactonase
VYAEKFHQWRVTLLPGVLEAARHTLMLAAGADKAEPFIPSCTSLTIPRSIRLKSPPTTAQGAIWFLDKAAAGAALGS